jgi:predicted branched-subunit amino acid permease
MTGMATWPAERISVLRDALGVGVAVGAWGFSFGALSVTAGLSVPQTCALSVLMFSGASQFAFVGVVASGGSPMAGVATATFLGARNAFYGLRLSTLVRVRGARRAVAAQLVIDESAGMAISRDSPRAARLAFWATGLSVFVCWNLATLVGAFGVGLLGDPRALGLDVVGPAAFVALLAPRMTSRRAWVVAVAAAAIALLAVPFVATGVPMLLAAFAAAAGPSRPGEER